MSPIELFLRIAAMIAIIMAIVFIEMIGVAIAEAFNQEQKEESEENKEAL